MPGGRLTASSVRIGAHERYVPGRTESVVPVRLAHDGLAGQRGQRPLALLRRGAARLAAVAQPRQPRDLALALDARGMLGRKRADELGDAVAHLQREVRRRGAGELAHVLDGDLPAGTAALWVLGFAHDVDRLRSTGTISSSASRRAWAAAETARSSPITQP